MKRTLLAMALLLTSVFGVTACGSDDDEAPVESRIKNSTGDDEIKRKYTYDDSLDSLGLSKKLYDDDINDHDSLDRDLFRLKDVDDEYEDDIYSKDLIEYYDHSDKSGLMDVLPHDSPYKGKTGGSYGSHREDEQTGG